MNVTAKYNLLEEIQIDASNSNSDFEIDAFMNADVVNSDKDNFMFECDYCSFKTFTKQVSRYTLQSYTNSNATFVKNTFKTVTV